ncbi:MAG: PilZ domain-containing protein [Sphingomonadaceae bacterium]
MSAVDTRHISRDSLFMLAEVRTDSMTGCVRVRVRNLSAGGMMAEGEVEVMRGTRLAVNLRNVGWVEGTVAWVQENRFGIAFGKEIDPAKVRPAKEGGGNDDSATPSYLRTATLLSGKTADPSRLRKL